MINKEISKIQDNKIIGGELSYTKLFETISKPWASIDEIRIMANNCGRDTAIDIRNNIQKKIKKEGKELPRSKKIVVPTKYVLEYLNLDLEYIIKMSLNEQKINNEQLSNKKE